MFIINACDDEPALPDRHAISEALQGDLGRRRGRDARCLGKCNGFDPAVDDSR